MVYYIFGMSIEWTYVIF